MSGKIEIIEIDPSALVTEAQKLKDDNWRLLQAHPLTVAAADGPGAVQLTYSFEKDYLLRNLRFSVPAGSSVPSISSVYLAAFLYENEISEMCDVRISGMAVDFNGTLYKKAVRHPFAKFTAPNPPVPQAKPAHAQEKKAEEHG
ncbi:MAG: NADH-quinone oxidoreductase subunit C [Elusimicrobiaceae bacterium]|nr:NADH-quinone oxidoreductase subunit C [Elusimicrobiaceae bacterium]